MSMIYKHHKHYIGNVSSNKFYYKNAIFTRYYMSVLLSILPTEIVDHILEYVCSSLVVFATNNTILYINPKDNAVIKTIELKKIRTLYSNNNTFAISEDGLTFYRIYRRHIELEYLCDEIPDPEKPPNKQTFDTNRYYYSYNIARKCPFSTPVYKYNPSVGNFGDMVTLSTDGKYIAKAVDKENVINHSGAYIAIYQVKTKKIYQEINYDGNKIVAFKMSPNNNMIAAVVCDNNNDTFICIWNIHTGDIFMRIQFPANMFFDNHDHEISWCQNSLNVAISCRLDYQNLMTAPIGTDGSIMIDSSLIIITPTQSYVQNLYQRYINKIAWIDSSKYVYFGNKEIVVETIDDEIVNNIQVSNAFVQDIKTSLDGHIINIHTDFNSSDKQTTDELSDMNSYSVDIVSL